MYAGFRHLIVEGLASLLCCLTWCKVVQTPITIHPEMYSESRGQQRRCAPREIATEYIILLLQHVGVERSDMCISMGGGVLLALVGLITCRRGELLFIKPKGRKPTTTKSIARYGNLKCHKIRPLFPVRAYFSRSLVVV